MGNSNQRRFSVGLDLGGAQISVSVYDHARRCSIPLDIDGEKTLTAAVAIEGTGDVAIVGARAEKRSGKKSATVFTGWRQMLYGMADEWEEHCEEIEEKWHFNTAPGGKSAPRAYALAQEGQQVSLAGIVGHLVEAVCASLLEHGPQVDAHEEVHFDAFAVAVPECLTPPQREVVLSAVEGTVKSRLGGHIVVTAVNEPLCAALQLCSIPPVLLVDWGASKLSVSVFELRMVGGEAGEVVLEEVVSRSNVFVSGAEVEWQ
ncbi:hypothetical protein T484DRAFT_1815747, partial [Baffinella frigidus]